MANLHVAQPYPLARPRRTLHIKMLISDRAILEMEKAGWCEAGRVWGGGGREYIGNRGLTGTHYYRELYPMSYNL